MGVGKISNMILGLPMEVGFEFFIWVGCFETAIADLRQCCKSKQAIKELNYSN